MSSTEPGTSSTLAVRLHGIRVGALTLAAGRLKFAYDEPWLGSREGTPLSCSLPLRAGAFADEECRPFFANLLPDGGEREGLARALGVSERNDFGLLAAVGGDCGGAVSLGDAQDPARLSAADFEIREVEIRDADLEALFVEMDSRPMLAGRGVRMSLAGAQPKLPVIRTETGWRLPGDGRPSTHILKPEPQRFAGLAENEHACLELARAVGLDVPPARLLDLDRPALEIERYDRTQSEGRWERLHQEDFCQALAVLPDAKYESEGGPGFGACVRLLRDRSTRPAADVLSALRWLAFNVLIGNCDGHAKNLSLILEPAPRLAPFYDLVATIAFKGVDHRLAMSIGGERLWDRLGPPQWARLAKEIGVAEGLVLREVRELSGSIPGALEALPRRSPRLEELSGAIKKRCAHVGDRIARA